MKSIEQMLTTMRQREKIPASLHRTTIRTRLLESYPETKLAVFETRIGWVGVAFSERGIIALHLPRPSRAHTLRDLQNEFPRGNLIVDPPADIARELREYALGRRREFDLPLDWSAIKPFQRAVLMAARKIPFGETRSYGWIAHEIGNPRASRAVGQALHNNPVPIIVPCHRVLASNGGLGGYAGGLALKKKLLQLEGATINL
jgi:methylated-DNA-[protein]-cysteine S-methyltransferase